MRGTIGDDALPRGGLHAAIVIAVYRMGNFFYYKVQIPVIREVLLFLYYIIDYLIVRTILNCEIPAQCRIGRNLRLPHGGREVVIDRDAIIGDHVTLYHQVTIGRIMEGFGKPGSPVIGHHVLIGSGAKILGPVHIGDYAKIEANSVVLRDVPADATAVGIPAKIIYEKPEPGAEETEETAEDAENAGHAGYEI
ncbi:MAG TPA: DapH/DapD/GlmU-related protein [Paenibacillaceae bacterium]